MSYEGTQRWRKKAKTWIVRYMGGKCSVCGYNKYDGNLASHHIDEKTKEKTISSLINKCHSWKKILKEADKCVLVCHNCHGEIHIGMTECPDLDSERRKLVLEEIESEKPIPKSGKYHYCPECGEMVNDLQKYCSNDCKNKAQQRIKWPEGLVEMVNKSSKSAVARMLGVSDKSVAKRLENHHK